MSRNKWLSACRLVCLFLAFGGAVSAATPLLIDLGMEGQTFYICADVDLSAAPEGVELSLGTIIKDQKRVSVNLDGKRIPSIWLYNRRVTAEQAVPEGKITLLLKIVSHAGKNDEAYLQVFTDGLPEKEPQQWLLSNLEGASEADLKIIGTSPSDAAVSNIRKGRAWRNLFKN